MQTKKYFLGILILILIENCNFSTAQDSYTLYFMKNVPQSSYLNPSFSPDVKYFIGFPLLSKWNVGFENNAFSYHDIVTKRSDDSLVINQDKILNGLSKNNILNLEVHDEILGFGFHVGKKNWMQFGINQHLLFSYNYTEDFFKLILKGNAQFIGQTAELGGNFFNGTLYHDIGLSFARKINDKLTMGLRVKYLIGLANVYSEESKMNLTTDETTFGLTGNADILLHASYPNMDNFSMGFYGKNSGWAFDIGGQYKLNEKFSFSLSATDLFGYIKWKENPRTFTSNNPNAEFVFNGFNFDSIFSGRKFQQDFLNRFADSLKKTFDITETNQAYTSYINTKLFLAGYYNLSQKDLLGLMLRNEFIHSTFKPSVTASYFRRFGKNLNLAITYSIHNHTYSNLGLGINGNIGPFQLYVITDNIIGLISLLDTRKTNVTFGLNLVFGKDYPNKKVKKRKDTPLFDATIL